MKRFAIALSLAIVLFLGGALPLWTERVSCPEVLTTADREAIAQVKEAYRRAWLAGDSEAVLRLFAADAVLMSHHGGPAVAGKKAIGDFWWPANSPKTSITKFEISSDDISGDGRTAVQRGRFELAWTMEDQGKVTAYANAGTFLSVFRKLADGEWKFTHHMWDDPPTQVVRTQAAR